MMILYQNARIVDRDQDTCGCVLTREDQVYYVGTTCPKVPVDQVVDLAGKVLMPAFVDLHCHLRDPGYEYKETLETGMKAALKGGYATLCAMANTNPVCETPEMVLEIQRRAQGLNLCRLYQSAAAGVGLEDKVPTDYEALSRVTPILTNDGKTIFSDAFMEQLLVASQKYPFFISTHCQPERQIVARDLALLEKVGGDLHVGHISRAETVEMIRQAKGRGLAVTCEVTPHHLFGYDCDYKVNPPLRRAVDVQALIEGIKDGTVFCLATDHAPHSPEDKAKGMAGISNIEYAFQIYWKVFSENGLSLQKLSELNSCNPNLRLHRSAGLIRQGYAADLVVVDPEAQDTIRVEDMISKSKNTPFAGRSVRGRVLKTIVGGEVRYEYGCAL